MTDLHDWAFLIFGVLFLLIQEDPIKLFYLQYMITTIVKSCPSNPVNAVNDPRWLCHKKEYERTDVKIGKT